MLLKLLQQIDKARFTSSVVALSADDEIADEIRNLGVPVHVLGIGRRCGAVAGGYRLFRLVRMSLSALNQNMQENLAGLQVVQLSQRQAYNLARYTKINEENRAHELRTSRFETLYGAFNDSMAHLALGVVIWYGGGAAVPSCRLR